MHALRGGDFYEKQAGEDKRKTNLPKTETINKGQRTMNNEQRTNEQPIVSETPVIDGMQATAPVKEAGELSEGIRRKVITSLGRFVAEAKHRFDECRNNLEDGSEGGYDPPLAEAIELLEELKKGVRHHDDNTLAAVYRKGFEDAKRTILKEIQGLVK